MAHKKHPKIQEESFDSSDDTFKENVHGEVAGSDNENDDNNCIEFVADGSIVVSKMALIVNHVSENLLKLYTNVVKTVVEWCIDTGLYHDHLSKLEEFYDLPEDAMDYSSQKLSIGLELIVLIQTMHQSVSDKLDSMHDDVAWHVGALDLGIPQSSWMFLLVFCAVQFGIDGSWFEAFLNLSCSNTSLFLCTQDSL